MSLRYIKLLVLGLIAQWIEHPPSKRVVAGSSPAQSITLKNFKMLQKTSPVPDRIGSYAIAADKFPDIDNVFLSFKKEEFKGKSARKRFQQVNEELLKLIQNSPQESFLLAPVINFIDRVNNERILKDVYHISLFEFWLNQFSQLSDAENYKVRAKIAGKYIPREDYQVFFPIGMDKMYSGTHFIAAHLSPDVDTMVASFWGWLDAFATRVGNAQHLWSLPGGPPDSPMTLTFIEMFGIGFFKNAAHFSSPLVLRALDLVTQKGFVKEKGTTTISTLDLNSTERAVILVDENGHYLGDWQNSDVEPIRKIVIRFKSCLRWFENNLYVKLISLFAKKKLHIDELQAFLSSVFDVHISDCEPAKEFTDKQKSDLDSFFVKVLGMKDGLHSTFKQLNKALADLSVNELLNFQSALESLHSSPLFDEKGNLREDRPAIFTQIEELIKQLNNAIHRVRGYAETLEMAIAIKNNVFGFQSEYAIMRNDVEDIRVKMNKSEYLTVVISEEENKLFPIGVIWANDINKSVLGTISFRDFCNQEEVRMAPYLSPISVVDHHKASLKTSSAPMALVGDAQSCNVLVAEQAFGINDRYSLGGMNRDAIEQQIERLRAQPTTATSMRLLQRLGKRHLAAESRDEFFISAQRELIEYLSFLNAILDDTDLLTKVSKRDIECIVELLNRVKSLTVKEEVEVINLDNIPRDKSFCKAAAKKILQNEEMYSIYKQVFTRREREIEKNLELGSEEDFASLFVDTKAQNGCCQVGQTKLFSVNFPKYLQKEPELVRFWLKKAQDTCTKHPEIDLYLHMISTIASSDEVYEEKSGQYQHLDELWFWIPPTQKAFDHLSNFLNSFQSVHKFGKNANLDFVNASEEVQNIFLRDLGGVPQKKTLKVDLPVVVLRFPAGMLNSRKAMVTPYLPRI